MVEIEGESQEGRGFPIKSGGGRRRRDHLSVS